MQTVPAASCRFCHQPLYRYSALPGGLAHEGGMYSCPTDASDPRREFDDAVAIVVRAVTELVDDTRKIAPTLSHYSHEQFLRDLYTDDWNHNRLPEHWD